MRNFLGITAVVSLLIGIVVAYGLYLERSAPSVFQELGFLLLFILSAVCVAGAAIIDRLDTLMTLFRSSSNSPSNTPSEISRPDF